MGLYETKADKKKGEYFDTVKHSRLPPMEDILAFEVTFSDKDDVITRLLKMKVDDRLLVRDSVSYYFVARFVIVHVNRCPGNVAI